MSHNSRKRDWKPVNQLEEKENSSPSGVAAYYAPYIKKKKSKTQNSDFIFFQNSLSFMFYFITETSEKKNKGQLDTQAC